MLKKLAIQLKEQQNEVIDNAISTGVHYAEQVAQNAIKNNEKALSSDDKKNLAVGIVNGILSEANVHLLAESLSTKIEAFVNKELN